MKKFLLQQVTDIVPPSLLGLLPAVLLAVVSCDRAQHHELGGNTAYSPLRSGTPVAQGNAAPSQPDAPAEQKLQ